MQILPGHDSYISGAASWTLYTCPPKGTTVICADELGSVTPRTVPLAPGWSPGRHPDQGPAEYSRGPGKTWVYGALRPADHLLRARAQRPGLDRPAVRIARANRRGPVVVIIDNLSSHSSWKVRQWRPSTRASARCSSRSARAG
ncbi:hypothetical protein GCM10009609_18310 [Pseudonocardia aurantiaca]